MMNVTFDTLNAQWNRLRQGGQLQTVVSGLTDPSQLVMQRTAETPDSITVMFRGFDQALDNSEQDGPILKRFILQWVKQFAPAQIARGDASSFILIITKPVPTAPAAAPVAQQTQPAMAESLVHIARIKKVHDD